jgi:hypothetical protein
MGSTAVKCEIFYTTEAEPLSLGAGTATLRCVKHNCTWIISADICLIGRVEVLEERVAQLERPQSNIDELGNPTSLAIPIKGG